MIDTKKELVTAYQHTFEGPLGELVLKDILNFCGVDRSTFNHDALTMAFNEGQRNVGLYIKAIVTADLDKIMNQPSKTITDPK